MHAVISIARFTVIEARRSQLLWFAFGLACVTLMVAEFSALLAITDSQSYRTGVYGALSRVMMVLLITLFVVTSVQRERSGQLLDLAWSRPLSRANWYAGRLLGFFVVALALALLSAIPLLMSVPSGRVLYWGVSLAAELALLASASLAIAVSLRQITAAVTAVGIFYLLARAIDAIVLMSRGAAVDPGSALGVWMRHGVEALALLLPAMNRFTRSEWLSPAAAVELAPVLLQAGIYIVLLAALGLFDCYRQER